MEDGRWKDIDNSLIESKDEDNAEVLENRENDTKIKFSKKAKAKRMVVIKKDHYEISWGIDKAKSTALKVKDEMRSSTLFSTNKVSKVHTKKKKSKSAVCLRSRNRAADIENEKVILPNIINTVEFIEIFKNIDLQYDIISNTVKERFVIKDRSINPNFSFNLEVKNLVPALQKDNSILFYDSKDNSNLVFKITPPFMYDGNNEISNAVKLTLQEKNKQYILIYTLDSAWINDSKRVLPIIVDPQVETSLDVKSIKDSYISYNSPNTNYQNSEVLKIGREPSQGIFRSYIKFTLPDQITTADLIIGAKLNLTLFSDAGSPVQVNVHGVNENWESDSITWANQPDLNLTTPPNIEDYQFIQGKKDSSFSWDITGIAKRWYSSGVNSGLMLKNNEENSGYNMFYSSDARSTWYHPQATITYVNNSGLEPYWTYHSQDVRRAGTGYINDSTGNLVYIHNDLSMSGSKFPLTLNHVFNSNEREKSIGYGNGWRLNLSQRVDASPDSSDAYIYTDEDGTRHYFFYDSTSKVYKEETGLEFTLTKNADSTYTIKDKKETTLEFTSTGYLYKVMDKIGNNMTLSYTGAVLKTITDGAGRVTTLDVLSNGYLVGIIEPSGRRTSFSYMGAQLSSIMYEDKTHSDFTYDDHKNLKTASYNGYSIQYDYYERLPFRVKNVQERGTDGIVGGTLGLEYGYNTTIFRDGKGRKSIYQFNDRGNTLCIKDSDGSAQYYKYFTEATQTNKLSLESKPQKFSKNYIKNHNAENLNTDWTIDNQAFGSFTTEASYLGKYSLKVTNNDIVSRHFYSQAITLQRKKDYVFSAYIKAQNIGNQTGKGAALFIRYQDVTSAWVTLDSKYITGTTEWERYEFKFTLPLDAFTETVYAGVAMVQETGTAYFDCLQLEEGSIANRYNLIENADIAYGMDSPSYWTKNSSCNEEDKVVIQDDKRALRINGNATLLKNFYQKITTLGKIGDIYSIGAWAKGASVPISGSRHFSIIIGVSKDNKEAGQWEEFFFNEDSLDWQYISDRFETKIEYDSITIYAVYYNNANTAYFTNLQLYKEEFGFSYKYDKKGNLTSVADLAKQESTSAYDFKNDLTNVVSPSGAEFKYEYNEDTRTLKKATSGTNVVYSFDYDSSGNPIRSRVGEGNLFIEGNAKYSANGNYLKVLTDGEGNSIIHHYEEAKGLLIANTDSQGSKTTYDYDSMDRLLNVSKILDTRNIEYFPLDGTALGNKGTKPKEVNAIFDKDPSGNMVFSAKNPASKLYYDLGINKASGSMAIWFYTSGTGTRIIFGNEGSNKQIFNLYINDQNNIILNYRDGSDITRNILNLANITLINNQWYHVALTWSMNKKILNCKIYVNNVAYAGSVTDFKDFTGGITGIGSSIFGAYQLNGFLKKFVYTPSVLTPADITTLYSGDILNDIGTTINNSYSYVNDRIKTINHNGFSYSFDYDAYGRNTAVFAAGKKLIENTYETSTGNLIEAAYGNGQKISIAYDALDRIISKKFKPDSREDTLYDERYTYEYDSAGNLGYHQDKVNNVNYRYIYDFADRLVKISDSNGNYTRFGYDANNNGDSITYKINTNYYDTSYSFDKDNRPDGVYYGPSLKNNILVEYFPLNGTVSGSRGTWPIVQNPVYYTDEKGNTVFNANSSDIKVLYDLGISKVFGTMSLWINRKADQGVQILANEGANKELLNLYLDKENKVRLAVRTAADVFTDLIITEEALSINEWNFIALKWISTGSILDTTLFLNGKIYTKSTTDYKDFTGGKTALGTSINGLYPLNGYIKDFSYSKLPLTNEEILAMYHGNSLKYQYDTLGRIEKKKINAGTNSFEALYTYLKNPITGTETNKVASIVNKGVYIDYEYDAKGNITKITDGGKSILYRYNELNELIQEDNQILNKTIQYSYNLGGNLSGKSETPIGGGTEVKTQYSYYENWKDQLKYYNNNLITYDDIGNLKTYSGYTYSWEEGRRLKSILGNGKNISFKYNASGIRTEKTVDGVTTKYFLSGNKVIQEDNGTDKIYYTYDSTNDLISMNLTSTSSPALNGEYFYIRNAQGDIIGLFDKDMNQVVSYIYDSWGKFISINGTLKDSIGVKNPYRYRGYRYDSETGFYYLNSRYYYPEWGRYINADSEGGEVGELLSHNVFAYCGNNPVNRVDPNGNSWGIIGEFFQQLASAIKTFAPAYAVGGSFELEPGPGTIAGLAIAAIVTIGAIGYAGYRTYKSSTQTSTTSTTITAATDIPISNRKSGSYYPAGVDSSQNTVGIDFSRTMNLANAQQYVRNGGDVYTFAQHNAATLALTTGG